MTDHFAVYEHIRTDTGAVFYVGKGNPDRLRSVTRRHNKYHSRIYNKTKASGFAVEQRIIADKLPEESSHTIEKMRIAMWRAAGVVLVNMTEGGEGLSNPSEDVRARIGAAHKGMTASAKTRAKIAAVQNTPEMKALKSATHKGKVVAETTKDKLSDAAAKQFSDPAARKLASQLTKARFANPDERRKQSARTSAFFEDPATRKAAAGRTAAQFADPVKRERHRLACLAAAAKRRAEKAA